MPDYEGNEPSWEKSTSWEGGHPGPGFGGEFLCIQVMSEIRGDEIVGKTELH